jgi:hypothetical protein
MRHRLAIAAAIGALTIAAPGAAEGQAGDSAVGSGTILQGMPGDVSFDLDAHSGPSGEDPSGHLTFAFPQSPTPIEGSVGCLRVAGNTAVVGVNFLNAAVPSGFLKVVDAPVDTLNLGLGTAVLGPDDCPADVVENPLALASGDIVVVDAQPFPTSKEQCKQGGWRDFPDFRNQGDCISFVSRPSVPAEGSAR